MKRKGVLDSGVESLGELLLAIAICLIIYLIVANIFHTFRNDDMNRMLDEVTTQLKIAQDNGDVSILVF